MPWPGVENGINLDTGLFMSTNPINFVVTKAGLNALLNASDKSIKLSLTKFALGSGQYTPNADRVALAAKFAETGISAGGIDLQTSSLRFTVIMNHQYEKQVSEIGLFTSTGVLFAVASLPNGAFFRLYPSIDYVANFGLILDHTADIGSLNYVLDGRAGQALKLMQQHLDAADPHPQYKVFSNQIMKDHLAATDPHPQYASKVFVTTEIKKLDAKINSLMGIAEYLFPPALEVGYSSLETNIATRRKGANYSWLNRSIVYHFCPESSHEGWRTTREATSIKTQVFTRSGTGRIGYSGRSNFLLIDLERTLQGRGFIDKNNQLGNEIKSGVFEVGEKLSIQREAWETLSYSSNQVAIIITPEGQHEGWEITRSESKIDINVYDRSGNNRTGYSGRLNWSLFKVNPNSLARDKYPLNLITGIAETAKFTIPAPVGFDFTDPNFFPLITPESQHEYWTVKRVKTGFEVEVLNRNGSNRADYKGKTSWAVFMMTKSTKRTILNPGKHTFQFKAGHDYRITFVGGGGAGGNAIYYHSGATPLVSQNGGNTSLEVSGFKVVANGGKGAIRGCWNNGSAYRDGASGAGGTFIFENGFPGFNSVKAEYESGTAGTMAQNNVGAGGVALYGKEHTNAGQGGKGAAGSGTRQLGFGGSGGGAASGQVTFNCITAATASITVGAGGKYYNDPEEYYQKSWHYGFGQTGNNGVIIIEESEAT